MSKEQWFWLARNTNIFNPPQTDEENPGFKCPVCYQKFKKAGKRNAHLAKEHPRYRGKKKSEGQNPRLGSNPDNAESAPQGRSRKRKRKKEKSSRSKKQKKIRDARRNLGLPLLQNKTKVHERIIYAKAYKKLKHGEKGKYSRKIGVAQRKLRKWVKDLHLYEKCHRRSRYLMKKKRNGKFFPQQKELFKRFTNRRQRGRKVSYHWLRVKMKFICESQKPHGYDKEKHKFTDPWVRAFCKRWGISSQRRTNKKNKSVLERIHLISNFLYYIIYLAPKSAGNVES